MDKNLTYSLFGLLIGFLLSRIFILLVPMDRVIEFIIENKVFVISLLFSIVSVLSIVIVVKHRYRER